MATLANMVVEMISKKLKWAETYSWTARWCLQVLVETQTNKTAANFRTRDQDGGCNHRDEVIANTTTSYDVQICKNDPSEDQDAKLAQNLSPTLTFARVSVSQLLRIFHTLQFLLKVWCHTRPSKISDRLLASYAFYADRESI